MSDDSASRSTDRLTFRSRRIDRLLDSRCRGLDGSGRLRLRRFSCIVELSDARSNPSARANHCAGGVRDNELVDARLKITPSILSVEFPRGTGLNMAQLQSLRGTSVKETLPTAADYLELCVVHTSIEDYSAHGLRPHDGLHGRSIRSAADQHQRSRTDHHCQDRCDAHANLLRRDVRGQPARGRYTSRRPTSGERGSDDYCSAPAPTAATIAASSAPRSSLST